MSHQTVTGPADGENGPTFTVLIPTFNRARLIERALESTLRQCTTDMEVLIVDDGSTDGTDAVVRKWTQNAPFPIRYYWQENLGKPAAYNSALSRIRGAFTVVLDSDDILADNALPILSAEWAGIPEDDRHLFAGVEGLCADMRTGCILGDPFPWSPMDSDFLETRYRYGVSGDKRHAIRTEVMREYPFPLFKGEKHMRESVIWARMAHRYKFRYVNKVIQLVEQQPDGLSAQPFCRRMGSPRSFELAFREMVNLHARFLTPKDRYRAMKRYIRYAFAAGTGPTEQLREMERKALWLLALPEGAFEAAWDRIRLFVIRLRRDTRQQKGN